MGQNTKQGNAAWMIGGFLIILSVALISWTSISKDHALDKISGISSLDTRDWDDKIRTEFPKIELNNYISALVADTIPDVEELLKKIQRLQAEELKEHSELLEGLAETELKRALEMNRRVFEEINLKLMKEIQLSLPDLNMDSLNLGMNEAREILEETMEEWKAVHEQEMIKAKEMLEKELEDLEGLDQLEEKMKALDLEMRGLDEEMKLLGEKFRMFEDELEKELRKDGYLDKDEELENVQMNDGEIISINGRKFSPDNPEKYQNLIKKHLGDDFD